MKEIDPLNNIDFFLAPLNNENYYAEKFVALQYYIHWNGWLEAIELASFIGVLIRPEQAYLLQAL